MTVEAPEEWVIARVHRVIQAKMAGSEALASGIALAAERIANALLGDGHLLIAGVGPGRSLASLLHQGIAEGFGFDRPGLPAVLLSPWLAADGEEASLATQVRALGRPQDCLALLATGPVTPGLEGILSAARSRDMPCILLGNATQESLGLALGTPDIELSATAETLALALEIQLSAIFALCESIERHLFGGSAT